MVKKAVFEVTTFADAIAKANRIAPSKGSAFDKAAGIMIELNPHDAFNPVLIKATDLEVTLRLQVNALELGDEECSWRIPASIAHGFMSTLPMGSGSTIKLLEKDDGYLYVQCNKTKARFRLIQGPYPVIPAFDPAGMTKAPNLAQRLQQVAWATESKGGSVLSGVHIDGTHLFGCDRVRMAMVPCDVPLDRSVTAPLLEVASIIKNTSEVMVRATEFKLELMPDDHTQATSVLMLDPYPDVRRIIRDDYTGEVKVYTAGMLAVLERMLVLAKAERSTAMAIEFGDGVAKVEMEAKDVGKIIDDYEVQGGVPDPLRMRFDATAFKDALTASGRSEVRLRFGPTAMHPITILDDNDFQSFIMPMRPD